MVTKHEYIEENEFVTMLDTDVEFIGIVDSSDPTLIKGHILESDIKTDFLVVIEKGIVSGSIECNDLSIYGECSGNIKVHDVLTLRKDGRINGDMRVNSLIVEKGGIINANCNMSSGEGT